ncbi:MAG: hypothetical protein H7Y17_01385 [Chlorobia bacterium]|nr:hypothetical protein [Fimbriimonadaceae bacterium]
MVVLNPSRWLLFAGILGTVTPWMVHWSSGFFTSSIDLHQVWVYAYFAAIAASLIAAGGAVLVLNRHEESDAEQIELLLAFLFGTCGLGSALLVFLLGMM